MALFPPDFLYRLPLYVITGLVSEFFFTALWDLINPHYLKSWNVFGKDQSITQPNWRESGRDVRAMGYSFLWMIPIYALLGLVEPGYALLKDWPFWLRGCVYVLILWLVEYVAGALIKKISGRNPWDYQMANYQLHGHIRFDFFPHWFVLCLIIEWLSPRFILLTPAIKEVFF